MINLPDLLEPRTIEVEKGVITRSLLAAQTTLRVDGRVVDLPAGATISPGLVDTHCHLVGPGEMSGRVDLVGARSAAEVLERTARFAAENYGDDEGDRWLLGFGWNEAEWPDQDQISLETLNQQFGSRPVSLYRIDTHAVWCNSAAIEQSGLLGRVDHAESRQILRDSEGHLRGLVMEGAIKRMEEGMPPRTREQYRDWYRLGAELCLQHGITEVHDMNVHPDWIDPLIDLAEAGELPIRVRLFLDGPRELWRNFDRPGEIAPNLSVDGSKYFADGALGSRGAWLLEPYADAEETRGVPTLSEDELVELARGPLQRGYAIATHAIGDAANRLVLNAYSRLRPEFPRSILRIEHAQIVHPDDLQRFADLNVLPVVQPIHCTSDVAMAEARLGTEPRSLLYPWNSFRMIGRPLLGGSDFPVESADPLQGMDAYLHRTGPDGNPWGPNERVSPSEALASYTSWAPLGVPGNGMRGRLVRGFDADLVVWEGNEPILTYVRGVRVER